jgi:hypothetical protein
LIPVNFKQLALTKDEHDLNKFREPKFSSKIVKMA